MPVDIVCDDKNYKQGDYVLYKDPKTITEFIEGATQAGSRMVTTITPNLCIGYIQEVIEPKIQSLRSKASNFLGLSRSMAAYQVGEKKTFRADEEKFKRRCRVIELKCKEIKEKNYVNPDNLPKRSIIYTLSPNDAYQAAAGQAGTVLDTIIQKGNAGQDPIVSDILNDPYKGGKRRTRRARSKRATRKYKR